MLAYRHGFHAGNHGDVLKHAVLVAVLRHLLHGGKDKGVRIIDTHAGAADYRLPTEGPRGRPPEWQSGIGRLWLVDAADSAAEALDPPPLVADWLAQVRGFNGPGVLRRYPGSPRLARALMRAQDELHLVELHPADHELLARTFAGDRQVTVRRGDGFGAPHALLPSPTRRALVVIDPAYERKTDYTAVLHALRESLTRAADATVLLWYPQVALREAAQLPARLRNAAAAAPKGWLHARLTVGRADAQGFGLAGSGLFIVNPPHLLEPMLAEALPWLAGHLHTGEGRVAAPLLEASQQ